VNYPEFYSALFRVTLPETALELAALLVLIVDLGFLRKAALKVRVTVAALLGVAGCGAALWTLQLQAQGGLSFNGTGEILLASGGSAQVAQSGILILTALTLLLLIDSVFTKHVGEYVAVVLMAATGGLLIAAAQDLLVIFIGLELLSLGLYILTAFAKSSAKSAEAAMKYYLFGGMAAAFLLFGFSYLYGITGSTNLNQIFAALAVSENVSHPLLIVAVVLIFAGLGFKVAAVPFHLWAPDTYEGAPAPAAAFIASVSKVASFALFRKQPHLHSPTRRSRMVGATECRNRGWFRLWNLLGCDRICCRALIHGSREPCGSGSGERAEAAGLLCYRTCRISASGHPYQQLRSGSAPFIHEFRARYGSSAFLRPHLRPDHHRRIRRGWRG
jgi:hypothetical protein